MQLSENNNFTFNKIFSFRERKNGYSKPIIAAIRKVIPNAVKEKIHRNKSIKKVL